MIEPEPGEIFDSYAKKLIATAQNCGEAQMGTFNGTELCAFPDSTIRELYWWFVAKRGAK